MTLSERANDSPPPPGTMNRRQCGHKRKGLLTDNDFCLFSSVCSLQQQGVLLNLNLSESSHICIISSIHLILHLYSFSVGKIGESQCGIIRNDFSYSSSCSSEEAKQTVLTLSLSLPRNAAALLTRRLYPISLKSLVNTRNESGLVMTSPSFELLLSFPRVPSDTILQRRWQFVANMATHTQSLRRGGMCPGSCGFKSFLAPRN